MLESADMCGPMETQTFSEAKYFVIFIDDYSRKLLAYMIRSKYQVLNRFQKFHMAVEHETWLSLKEVHSDNGNT